MDMRINAAGGQNASFSRKYSCRSTNFHAGSHTVQNAGIPCRADRFSLYFFNRIQLSVHEAVNTVDSARSAQRNQLDLLRIAGLEPDRSAGRNIQPHAVSRISIEIQSTIHFKEMAVRTNLNGP